MKKHEKMIFHSFVIYLFLCASLSLFISTKINPSTQLLKSGSTLKPKNFTPPSSQTSLYCLNSVGIVTPYYLKMILKF